MAIKLMLFHSPLWIGSSTTPNSKHSLVIPSSCWLIPLRLIPPKLITGLVVFGHNCWHTHTHRHVRYGQTPYIGPRSSTSLGPSCHSKPDDLPLRFIMINHFLTVRNQYPVIVKSLIYVVVHHSGYYCNNPCLISNHQIYQSTIQ